MKRLDVGCGNRPTGDVNVDLYTEASTQRSPAQPVDTKQIKNFVLADAQHLPFRSKSFSEVYSSNVIEHVEDPVLFLREAIRCAREKVTVLTCHRYWRSGLSLHQPSVHISFFNVKWFDSVLRNYRHEITSAVQPKPHLLLPLWNWPHDLTVEITLPLSSIYRERRRERERKREGYRRLGECGAGEFC